MLHTYNDKNKIFKNTFHQTASLSYKNKKCYHNSRPSFNFLLYSSVFLPSGKQEKGFFTDVTSLPNLLLVLI